MVVILLPGLVLTHQSSKKDRPFLEQIFLALITGAVLLTVMFYILSLLNLRLLIFIYILFFLFWFLRLKLFYQLLMRMSKTMDKFTLIAVLLTATGVIFQNIPVFKSGLVFPFGMGFWGPNTHDGVW